MRQKIQLDGRAVCKAQQAPDLLKTIPSEKLQPILTDLAKEVAEAAHANLEDGFLGLLVEAVMSMHGLGHLTETQKRLAMYGSSLQAGSPREDHMQH